MVKTCPALVPIPLRGVGVVLNFVHLNRNSERIPRSLLRGLASELQQINPFLAWKIPCTLVQGASICFEFRISNFVLPFK